MRAQPSIQEIQKFHAFRFCLIPALARLGDNIGGNVGDVLVGEAAAERRHGTLAVGNLGNDRLLLEAAGEVLDKEQISL